MNDPISAAKEFENGELLIAEGCSYSLDDRATCLNNNVLITGGTGTGKTRHIVEPNIRQALGSYIIVDPKGNLSKKYSSYLEDRGYKIRVLDFVHPELSCGYNPIDIAVTTQDYIKLASTVVNSKESENCDTCIYLGGNDLDTAEAISLRCDCPLRDVLYMPVGQCFVFRRGSEPVITKLLQADLPPRSL